MLQINDLPLEIKFKIFELLEIGDILVSRLVCKHWQAVLGEIRIDELSFHNQKYFAESESIEWHFGGMQARNVIGTDKLLMLNLLQSTAFNLKNLKRLMIRGSVNEENFNLEQLNRFAKLEVLEMDEWKGDDGKLVLPKLKRLYLSSIYSGELTIDSPSLESLVCRIGLPRINLLLSTTLKHLEIFVFRDKVFDFVNLETLRLDQTFGVTQNMLQRLPKLREIEFKLRDYTEDVFESTIQTLNNLVVERQRLNRADFKIFFKGILVTSKEQVNEFDPEIFFMLSDSESESNDSEDFVYNDDSIYEGSYSDLYSSDEFD